MPRYLQSGDRDHHRDSRRRFRQRLTGREAANRKFRTDVNTSEAERQGANAHERKGGDSVSSVAGRRALARVPAANRLTSLIHPGYQQHRCPRRGRTSYGLMSEFLQLQWISTSFDAQRGRAPHRGRREPAFAHGSPRSTAGPCVGCQPRGLVGLDRKAAQRRRPVPVSCRRSKPPERAHGETIKIVAIAAAGDGGAARPDHRTHLASSTSRSHPRLSDYFSGPPMVSRKVAATVVFGSEYLSLAARVGTWPAEVASTDPHCPS